MNRQSLALFMLLAGSQVFPMAYAADDAASRNAAARYESDKKLCAEESTSGSRMQCLRDARAEYDKALAGAEKSSSTGTVSSPVGAACADCGKVLAVTVTEKRGEGSAAGMIGGGVVGALLGNQIGKGGTRDLATLAGAAGGAYAGHKIEEAAKSSKSWAVRVRLDSGEERSFAFDHDPAFVAGDLVKMSGGSLVRR
jgi:outer membrane lipoprotein SlyB